MDSTSALARRSFRCGFVSALATRGTASRKAPTCSMITPAVTSRDRAASARSGSAGKSAIYMAGSPKVPYKAPGQQDYQFIDVFERLARDRIIFVGQDIDDETANQIIATLLFLESEDDSSLVTMYFNSAGATTPAGFAVYDCMRNMKFPIATLNLGLAASMGAFLCATGTKGKRMALPNSRFLIQAPSLPDGVQGQAEDVAIEVRHTLNMRDKYARGLERSTGRNYDLIMEDLKRDFYLTAYEAREYGVIDLVLPPKEVAARQVYASGLG